MEKKGWLVAIAIGILLSFFALPPVQAADCGGDTVCACNDTLTASRTLNDSDTLTTLSCSARGLLITAASVTLNCGGRTIDGDDSGSDPEAGIELASNASTVIIQNCTITDFQNGILINGSSGIVIVNNTIDSNLDTGITFWGVGGNGTRNVLVENNTLTTNGGASGAQDAGISFIRTGAGAVFHELHNISGNLFRSNENGIYFDATGDWKRFMRITNNTFTNHTTSSDGGVFYSNSVNLSAANNFIANNTFENNVIGILVQGTGNDNNTIADNFFLNSSTAGISAGASFGANNSVYRNTFNGSGFGPITLIQRTDNFPLNNSFCVGGVGNLYLGNASGVIATTSWGRVFGDCGPASTVTTIIVNSSYNNKALFGGTTVGVDVNFSNLEDAIGNAAPFGVKVLVASGSGPYQNAQGAQIVNLDNLTVDCAGEFINGSLETSGMEIASSKNLSIRNCSISGFRNVIRIGTSTSDDVGLDNAVIENNNFTGNFTRGTIILSTGAENVTIANNTLACSATGVSNGCLAFSGAFRVDNILVLQNNITATGFGSSGVVDIQGTGVGNLTFRENSIIGTGTTEGIGISDITTGIVFVNTLINATGLSTDDIDFRAISGIQGANFSNVTISTPQIDANDIEWLIDFFNVSFVGEGTRITYPLVRNMSNGSADFTLDSNNFFVNGSIVAVNVSQTQLIQFNTSANITISDINCNDYNITFNASFFRNDTVRRSFKAAGQGDTSCTSPGSCTEITCSNSVLQFNVPSWSSYAVQNGSQSVSAAIAFNVTLSTPVNDTYTGGSLFLSANISSTVNITNVTWEFVSFVGGAVATRVRNNTINLTFYGLQFDTTTITDGRYNITVNATNSSGTTANGSASGYRGAGFNITIDNTGPNTTLTVPRNTSSFGNVTLNFTWVSQDALDNLIRTVLVIDGVSRNDSNVSNATTFSTVINLSIFAEGSYNWSVQALDDAGNNQSSPGRNFIIDLSPPIALVFTPSPGGFATSTNVNFTFQVIDRFELTNISAFITVDSVEYNRSKDGIANNTNTTFNVTLAEGVHYWNISVNDTAANANTTSTFNFTLDATAPNTTLLTPANNVTLANTTVNFSWISQDNFDTTIRTVLVIDGISRNDSNVSNATPASTIFNLSILGEGRHNWTIQALDDAGNNATANETRNFTLDYTPPIILISQPANGTTFRSGSGNVNVNFTFQLLDKFETTNLSAFITVDSVVYNRTSNIANNTNTTFNVTLGDGVHYWNITVNDTVSNANTTVTFTVIIDNTAPNTTLLTPVNNVTFGNTTANFSWISQDNFDTSIRTVLVIDGLSRNDSNISNATATSTVFNLSSLGEGRHNWTVQALDDAGNNATANETRNFTTDYTPPIIILFQPTNGSTLTTGSGNVNVNFTFQLTDKFEASNLSAYLTVDSIIYNRTSGIANNTNTTFNVTLGNGVHYWNITANDTVANANTTITFVVIVDNRAPNTTLLTPVEGGIFGNITVNFSWISQDDFSSLIRTLLVIDGLSRNDSNVSNTTPFSTIFNLSSLGEGRHNWTVQAVDDAGNNATANQTRNFTADYRPPVIITHQPAAGGIGRTTEVNFTFQLLDAFEAANLSAYLTVDSVVYNRTSNIANNTNTTFNVTLGNGIHYWNITANDTAANSNTTLTFNFTVDTASPNITLNGPVGGVSITDGSSDATITFNWTATDNIDTNLTANLTINGAFNLTLISTLNNTATNVTVTVLNGPGTYFWNVSVYDDAGNVNVSETRNFTITARAPTTGGTPSGGGGPGTPSPVPPPAVTPPSEAAPSAAREGAPTRPVVPFYNLSFDEIRQDDEIIMHNGSILRNLSFHDFDKHLLEVIVVNKGTGDLHRLHLNLTLPENVTLVSITPEYLEQLLVGQQAAFDVKLRTGQLTKNIPPLNLSSLTITASSPEITAESILFITPFVPIEEPEPQLPFGLPRFLFPVVLLAVLLTLLRLLALNDRIRDLLRSIFRLLYKPVIADEAMVRFLIRERRISRYVLIYTTAEVYNRYRAIKNLRPIPPIQVSEREEILALSRKYGIDLELSRLLQFGASKTRAIIMTSKAIPPLLKQDMKRLEFVNEETLIQQTRTKAGIRQEVKIISLLLLLIALADILLSPNLVLRETATITASAIYSIPDKVGDVISPIALLTILKIIADVLLIVAIIILCYRVKNLVGQQASHEQVQKQLQQYIEHARKRGFSDEAIIRRLQESGWAVEEVQEALYHTILLLRHPPRRL